MKWSNVVKMKKSKVFLCAMFKNFAFWYMSVEPDLASEKGCKCLRLL